VLEETQAEADLSRKTVEELRARISELCGQLGERDAELDGLRARIGEQESERDAEREEVLSLRQAAAESGGIREEVLSLREALEGANSKVREYEVREP
jgi:uncharacterized coiled-coil DUF342 family protein